MMQCYELQLACMLVVCGEAVWCIEVNAGSFGTRRAPLRPRPYRAVQAEVPSPRSRDVWESLARGSHIYNNC